MWHLLVNDFSLLFSYQSPCYVYCFACSCFRYWQLAQLSRIQERKLALQAKQERKVRTVMLRVLEVQVSSVSSSLPVAHFLLALLCGICRIFHVTCLCVLDWPPCAVSTVLSSSPFQLGVPVAQSLAEADSKSSRREIARGTSVE